MAQISIIKKSDISEARRFDAEYFKPEYLDMEKKIKEFNYLELGDKKASILITDGDHGNPDYTQCINDMDYVKVEQLGNIDLDLSSAHKISNKCVKKQSKTNFVEKFDILLSMKGTLGKSCLVLDDYKAVLNRDVAKIQIKKEVLNYFYVLIYLKSKFGNSFIEKFASGAVQKGLYLNKIEKIKIPILPQSFQLQIEKIVKLAHEKQTRSKKLYQEAEQLLLEELGLVDYQPQHQLTFETSKKEIDEAARYDAEYFQPKYAKIIEKIENYEGGFDAVKNIVDWKKGIEVGTEAYTEKGKEFVRVSDFSVFGIENTSRKISEELFEEIKDDFQPQKGDILFTKDGTIGLAYVLKKDIDGVLSSAFLSLTLKEEYQDFKKECLALILNSVISKLQVEQLSGGAIIAHLKPSDFEKFKIPLIKPQIQTQIAEKIQESHKLRKESKELLEEAKRKVEEEIEKE